MRIKILAAKYCPRWLFNLSVAMTAYEFIISDMPIKAYAKKYVNGLNEHYGEIKSEELESTAESILRFLRIAFFFELIDEP